MKRGPSRSTAAHDVAPQGIWTGLGAAQTHRSFTAGVAQ